jgi:hypothetical protein
MGLITSHHADVQEPTASAWEVLYREWMLLVINYRASSPCPLSHICSDINGAFMQSLL